MSQSILAMSCSSSLQPHPMAKCSCSAQHLMTRLIADPTLIPHANPTLIHHAKPTLISHAAAALPRISLGMPKNSERMHTQRTAARLLSAGVMHSQLTGARLLSAGVIKEFHGLKLRQPNDGGSQSPWEVQSIGGDADVEGSGSSNEGPVGPNGTALALDELESQWSFGPSTSPPPDSPETDKENEEETVTSASGAPLHHPEEASLKHPEEASADMAGVESSTASHSPPRVGGSFQGITSGSGLLRSPTHGGVQSATSTHGLPEEAVAVRNLVAQSKRGHLCTIMSRMHHRRRGYPFSCLVDFANDSSGHPIFSLSPLAIHTRNLLADPRCTLVVQIPGWSGLADARVTLFGDVNPVVPAQQELAKQIFCDRHRQGQSEPWGNSYYFRMDNICDIHFVGGFGTVAWIDVNEYTSIQPDRIASEDAEGTLNVLNAQVASKLRDALNHLVKEGSHLVDSVSFIAVDGKGVDIRIQQGQRSNVKRLSFECPSPIETVAEAEAALGDILLRAALPRGLVEQQQ